MGKLEEALLNERAKEHGSRLADDAIRMFARACDAINGPSAKPDPDQSEALKVAVEALRTTAINRLPFTEERNTYDDGFTNGLLYALARLRELGVMG